MYEELVKRLREAPNDWPDADLHYEAADAIEELARRNEQFMYAPLPAWVPVTERLPDYPGRFLCYYEVDDYGEIGHCIDWGRYDPDDGWYVSGVTHWMPLPEPPEGEENGHPD